MTTKILIFKSMKKGIFNSNKKWKVKKSIAGFEPASFSGSVPIQWFCSANPLGHLAHEMVMMWNILEPVKLNPIWTWNFSLSFEKCCID